MSEKLIECVPNFSEGQNKDIIKLITNEIENVEGVRLLDVDPGYEMNRTVVTFIGNPAGVKEAAFRAIKKASEVIDMRKHKGSHPRMGATDVCPFVPVSGVTEEEVLKIADEVAERVGSELGIPIYMYERSARKPERKNLAIIRQGEYEGFDEKIKTEGWEPDFGPKEFNARSGATVMGVREFLIAYNINLNTREKVYATEIANRLREKGYSVRRPESYPFYYKGGELLRYANGNYPCGNDEFTGVTLDETAKYCLEKYGYDLRELLELNAINPDKPEGKPVKVPGKFKNCKAIGWVVPEYGRAQISINLTDYKVTSMHHVYEEARKLADERGILVTGSEIVGMVPYPALYECGRYFLAKQGRSAGVPVKDVLETALQSLGLKDVANFKIEDRVLGLPQIAGNTLAAMKVNEFADEVSRESPAPGGGSIAALAGALGAALASMVSNLTANKRGTAHIDETLYGAAVKCQDIKDRLIKAVDDDTNAFNLYMEARRLPQGSAEEKKVRGEAMLAGLKEAVKVPLNTAKLSLEALKMAAVVVEHGNPNSITDVGVGAQMAYAGLKGGVYNVYINLKDIADTVYVDEMKKICTEILAEGENLLQSVTGKVEKKIGITV